MFLELLHFDHSENRHVLTILGKYTFFIRKWFIGKWNSAAQKVKKVQYWIFET